MCGYWGIGSNDYCSSCVSSAYQLRSGVDDSNVYDIYLFSCIEMIADNGYVSLMTQYDSMIDGDLNSSDDGSSNNCICSVCALRLK